MPLVAVAIGSNLGDRRAHVLWAIDRLSGFLSFLRASSLTETAAVEVVEPQPPYINAAVVGETNVPARELLTGLLGLERERGRERPGYHSARTLDLDLIFYDGQIVDEPGLVIPHPQFRDRLFVLEPLAEIAGDWVDPVTRESVRDLLKKVREARDGQERRPSTGLRAPRARVERR